MRARNLKPSFFKNEDLAECKFETRLLFQGLWCLADKNGNLENRPKLIKAEVFPHDTIDVATLLSELAQNNLIILYESDGKKYIHIPSWNKHARPHPNEPELFPKPSESCKEISCREKNLPVAPLPSSGMLNSSLSNSASESDKPKKISPDPARSQDKTQTADRVVAHFIQNVGSVHGVSGARQAVIAAMNDDQEATEESLKKCTDCLAEKGRKTKKEARFMPSAAKFFGQQGYREFIHGPPQETNGVHKNKTAAEIRQEQEERERKEAVDKYKRGSLNGTPK
jgi:hypothetical protein